MEAPNIQLYNLFRHDLHLNDGKSLELMHLLDKEYKSSVKEDIAALSKQMAEGFQRVDARFEQVDTRFQQVDARFEQVDTRFQAIDDRLDTQDKRFDALDNKFDKRFDTLDTRIELKATDLRSEILRSHNNILIWMIGLILTLLLLFIGGAWFKK